MKNMMSFFRKNGFYVMALVLIAGILAISGIAGYVSGQSERNQAENAAEFKDRAAGTASNEAKLAESEAAVADEMTGYNADLVQKILSMIENGTLALEDFEEEGSMNGTAEASAKDAAVAENEPAEAAEDEPEADTEEAEMAGNVLNAGYSSENVMSWPVRGEVIMDYSMDKTIYYPTLQEYKCNPSILIQSEEGTDVAAAFSGTVADVYHDAQLGTVLEMSLGNGYEAYYGQLENVDVAVGDTVRQGQIIGTVSTPTRFYSIEGSHLNFRVTRDGEPVDPLDYLD
ncbi:M23 family metallopeptidase [Coprococcus catus]|nr:M23 family metallopeptidase [Coprococcus catus]MCT6798807.1 M23 family metallopeptidase [Coprococcus catus]